MSKRQQLKAFIENGSLNKHRHRTYIICNGQRTLRDDKPTNAPFDIDEEIYCNDLQQLELQPNKYCINQKK